MILHATVVLYFMATLFLVLFACSVYRDRRRLRNGVFLFLTLLFAAGGVVTTIAASSRSADVVAARLVFWFAAVLTPLTIVILALFLIANGVTMIRREGTRPANLLSLAAGVAICGVITMNVTAVIVRSRVLIGVMFSITLILGYMSFLFLCYLLYSVVYGRMRHRRDADFIVILGSGLVGSKVPPLLASRLDRARAAYAAELEKGRNPVLITSGGRGPDEEVAESRAMADYLISHGVPEDAVVVEDRSTTTEQNLMFSKSIMQEAKPDYQCLVVTNNFHAFRAALTARKVNLNGQVIGSPTAPYFWPSATIREFVAIVMQHRVANASICLVLAAFGLLLLRA
ncbi:MAG: YdcF family protein [Kutzneria sp.]|nr:YdcF family protein [Kutzneria sp.]